MMDKPCLVSEAKVSKKNGWIDNDDGRHFDNDSLVMFGIHWFTDIWNSILQILK